MNTDVHVKFLYRAAILAALFVLLISLPCDVRACDFDLDCDVGSKCRGGVCVGGLWPGNDNDDAPLDSFSRPAWDWDETYGDTCSFDVDCSLGMRCAKARGALEGVCVRGRR